MQEQVKVGDLLVSRRDPVIVRVARIYDEYLECEWFNGLAWRRYAELGNSRISEFTIYRKVENGN